MLIGVIAEELLLAEAARQSELFVDIDLFPSAALAIPGFLLLEGQFDSDDIFYQTVVSDGSKIILPQLVNDSDTFRNFTSSIIRVLAPSLVSDADIFYSPTVLSKVLGPSLVIDDDLFGGVRKLTQGKASINQQIPIDGIFDSDIFYGLVIERVGITLITQQAALSTDDEVVYLNETTTSTTALPVSFVSETATFTAPPLGFLSPNLFSANDVIFTSTASGSLGPSLFIDSDIFSAPTQGNYVVPGIFLNTDIFLAPSIARQLRPDIVSDADVFIGPTIGTPGRLGLVADDDLIFASTVRIAPLTTALVVDADIFLTPVIGAPAIKPNDAVIDFADTFFAPVIFATQELTPHLWVDVDGVAALTIAVGQGAQPGILIDSDALLAPSITVGATTLLPGIVTDTDAFYAPTITQAGFDGALALDGPIMPSTPQPTVIYLEG